MTEEVATVAMLTVVNARARQGQLRRRSHRDCVGPGREAAALEEPAASLSTKGSLAKANRRVRRDSKATLIRLMLQGWQVMPTVLGCLKLLTQYPNLCTTPPPYEPAEFSYLGGSVSAEDSEHTDSVEGFTESDIEGMHDFLEQTVAPLGMLMVRML